MPPAPMAPTISYGPRRAPVSNGIERVALLPLGGERALAQLAKGDLSLHRRLVHRAGIGDGDRRPLDTAGEPEGDGVALDAARHFLFAENLRRVGAGEVFSVLL